MAVNLCIDCKIISLGSHYLDIWNDSLDTVVRVLKSVIHYSTMISQSKSLSEYNRDFKWAFSWRCHNETIHLNSVCTHTHYSFQPIMNTLKTHGEMHNDLLRNSFPPHVHTHTHMQNVCQIILLTNEKAISLGNNQSDLSHYAVRYELAPKSL